MARVLPPRLPRPLIVAGLFPGLVLLASYVGLAIDFGRINLWSVVVHEDGRTTFAETVWYFRHFVREMPIVAMMASALALAFLRSRPTLSSQVGRRTLGRARFVLWGAACLLVCLGLAIAIGQQGLERTLEDLFQRRIRDGAGGRGSHWNYHLLHMAVFLPLSLVLCGLTDDSEDEVRPSDRRTANRWIGAWVVALVTVTLCSGALLQAFVDPRYLAHQAREIATHAALSVPIGLFALLLCESRLTGNHRCWRIPPDRETIISAGGVVLICAFVAFQLSGVKVLALSQRPDRYSSLVLAHHLEHTLDYLLVALLAPAIYLTLVRSGDT